MPIGEDLGVDSIGYDPNVANRLKLLELMNLERQGKRNAQTSMLGDILALQTAGKKEQADSYAPGTKYAAGWEPGGLMDSILAMGNGPSTGYTSMSADDPQRLISRVDAEDPETLVANALGIINRITGAEDEDNPVQKALHQALVKSLIPQSEPEGANAPIPGGTPSGTTRPSYDPSSAAGPMGGGPRRPNVPVMPENPSGRIVGKGLSESPGAKAETNVSQGISNMATAMGLEDPLTGLLPVADNSVNPQAAQAMVDQILQRAKRKPAPTAGKSRVDWGANTPGSKHPTGYKDGSQVFEGPTIIRVGERSPKDKKYATEEVVYAAPGTVVAPVPKGMENPSHEDAMGFIMAQMMKTMKDHPDMEMGEPKDNEVNESAVGSYTSSAPADRRAAEGLGTFKATTRQRNSEFNRSFGLQERQYFTNRDQGNRSLDLQGRGQDQNYDLGLRNWMSRNREADQSYDLGKSRLGLDRELGMGNLDLGRQNLQLNFQRAQDEVRNWEAERALKRELGMRGLDIDKQRADQDYALNSAQMAFQQIMAGITGSSLPGVRAGRTPQLSLLG